jgi:hypothetical protein
MATQIVIANKESITIDGNYFIYWADKGNSLPTVPNTVHFVIWNNLPGQNEVQNKNASTGNMTGNVILNSTSDVVYGSTTVADLLTWAETRKGEIETARTAEAADIADPKWTDENPYPANKSWRDYDSNYS